MNTLSKKELGILIGVTLIIIFYFFSNFIEFCLVFLHLSYDPGIISIVFFVIIFLSFKIYTLIFYNSTNFKNIKIEINTHIKNCNDLNHHIQELKCSFLDVKSYDFGNSKLFDQSRFNFSRREWSRQKTNRFIHNCSAVICKNANNQPFKYLCKYFDVKINDNTLSNIEQVLNDFSAAEQGKILLKNERDIILNNLKSSIPFLIYHLDKNNLIKKLGFEDIDLSNLYFPIYIFQYISAGGNSSTKCEIKLDIENLNKFIYYLNSIIKFQNSILGQRALMTSQLREDIKKRDNFTCQKCSISIYDETNLLLEIDHIIPLSKGGITSVSNLQTLCWKCNRSKGAKLEN